MDVRYKKIRRCYVRLLDFVYVNNSVMLWRLLDKILYRVRRFSLERYLRFYVKIYNLDYRDGSVSRLKI